MSFIAELKTKNILIVGGGTTGKSLANYLSSLGASFTVFDEKATTHNGLDATTEIDDYSIYDLAIVSVKYLHILSYLCKYIILNI